MALTCAVPATHARAPRRTTLTMPSAMDSASTARPSTTIAQLDRPSPKTITNTAMVPSTAATSLRAGAMGRPLWFANVDLPVVTDRLGCAGHGGKGRYPTVGAWRPGGTDRLTVRVSPLAPGGSSVSSPRSLVLIKPDAVRRGLVGEILGRFERKGLVIEAMVLRTMDAHLADQHYAEHVEKPFYPPLKEFMTSGPLVAMVVSGDDAI